MSTEILYLPKTNFWLRPCCQQWSVSTEPLSTIYIRLVSEKQLDAMHQDHDNNAIRVSCRNSIKIISLYNCTHSMEVKNHPSRYMITPSNVMQAWRPIIRLQPTSIRLKQHIATMWQQQQNSNMVIMPMNNPTYANISGNIKSNYANHYYRAKNGLLHY